MEIRGQCEKARNELEKTGMMNVQAAQSRLFCSLLGLSGYR